MATEPRSGKAVALVLVPSAIAVAGLMLFLRLRMEPPTIAPYAVVTGSPSPLRPGATFTLDLEPQGLIVGAISARTYLLQGDTVRPWDAPARVDRDGTVHLGGRVETLFAGVPPGAWDVAVAVGRPETMPTNAHDILRGRDAGPGPAPWHLLRSPIVLGP